MGCTVCSPFVVRMQQNQIFFATRPKLQTFLITGLFTEIYRGSYMSAHVLLNLFNELGKSDKMRGVPSILYLFRNELINSIIQEHEC